MAINEVRIGPFTAADGAQVTARGSRDSTTAVLDAHARYQEAVFRGSVYSAANQASQAITAVGTAMTGFILYNPIASGKNLALWEIDAAFSAVIAGTASAQVIALGVAVGPNVAAPTTVTALTIINNNLNGAVAAVGKAYSTTTFAGVTPTILKPLVGVQAATAVGLSISSFTEEVAGNVIIPPGAFVCLAFVGGAAPSLIASMAWEEIPV